jgi:ABC-2 type transport system ATP-binding protein
MSDAIVAENLQKRFGGVRAVADISLVVPRGARFGLIGQNGAGKTTFIKMLLGITRPDAGRIAILDGDPEDPAVRRRIGYLPERLAIPPSFSALSFLDSVARLKGVASSRRLAECKDLLHHVGLEEAAWSRKTGGYSKGMRQRTGLAAALVGQPELLILDEPTDGIDPVGRKQIRDVILDAAKAGTTVFLNSHLLAETEKVCDHVAVLHQGMVVRSGTLSTLQRKDSFRVVFVAAATDQATIEKAQTFGFVVDEERSTVDSERLVTRFLGTDAATLSRALARALHDGLVVLEVSAELVELETILEVAMKTSPAAREAA